MKFILDTNILLKALIRNSKVRVLLMNPNHRFYVPEYAIEEMRRHSGLIKRKSGLSDEEVGAVLTTLLSNLNIVPSKMVSAGWKEAEKIMADIDMEDIPFVAAALGVPCDGIWSDDKDLKRQRKVRVWNTREVIQIG